MSALLQDARARRAPRELHTMTVADVDSVLAIENATYEFPWSRGNFIDSLAAGYPSRVLTDTDGERVGYFVAMEGVEELHLLNLTVLPARQRQGHGGFMLDRLVRLARGCRAATLWLEVRSSNAGARKLYLHYGFRHIGVRRRYYPAARGQREDAAVMSLDVLAHPLAGSDDGLV